jgi:glycosyltransferase involved in cell wall biosynthesis
MKLFEYLLSERPIVAGETPAIRQIVSAEEVSFYSPDDAASLARAVGEAALHPETMAGKIAAAKRKGLSASWSSRAQRILSFIESTV